MGILKALKQCLANSAYNYTIELAGYMAFTALLSIFPFVIFLTSLAAFFGNEASIEILIRDSLTFIPEDVAHTILPIVNEILRLPHQHIITISILGAIWISSSGIEALRSGLNESYDLKETRSFVFRRLQSILIIIGAAILFCSVTFLLVMGDFLSDFLKEHMGGHILYFLHLRFSRYFLAAVLFTLMTSFFYYVIPNTRQKWSQVLPGAILSTCLWLALASIFSFYCRKFANYDVIYGSLGGIALTMLFLHLSAIFILLGAEFNAVLLQSGKEHKR